MKRSACILTNGKLDHIDAKTAHGLIRGTDRFDIVGVVDAEHAGRDAGEVLDGRTRNIRVYSSIGDLLEQSPQKPEFAIIGVALSGGVLPEDWNRTVLEALQQTYLRSDIERASRMAAKAFCVCQPCHEDESISHDLDVGLQLFYLFCCKCAL